jgi:sulfate transport system ATP-binding protein
MSIEVHQLRKAFGTTVVCDRLDLRVAASELVALLGPSGSGKTTLLRIMAGLDSPDAGQVLLHGEDATARDVRERRVGFVFQHYALFNHMTVFENVAFGLRVQPRARRPAEARIRARVLELLRLVQLDGLAGRYPQQLSGGQRQRIGLMRALMLDPPLLLLDEPLGALDPITRYELQDELKSIFRELGKTVVLVTHDMGEAAWFGDDIVMMREGRVVQRGTIEDLVERPAEPYVVEFLRAQRLPTQASRA